jgi:hypothetical protein
MKRALGFILLSHNKPQQAQRLVQRLNAMFDSPPIAWHHDFSKCDLAPNNFSANVSFVRPHVDTWWGEFSLVEATVLAMEQLYSTAIAPDRFVILSGSDYPIKAAHHVLADLQAGDFDAHMVSEFVHPDQLVTARQKLGFKRYHCYNFPPPRLYKLLKRRWPIFTVGYPRPLRGLLPFSKELECYIGDQWFSANRRTAEFIIAFHRKNSKLAKYFRRTMFSDECYFHTILGNAPQFKLNNCNWRYTDWSEGTSHPKTLGMADLPKMLASPMHFARKLDLDRGPEVFDQMDKATA